MFLRYKQISGERWKYMQHYLQPKYGKIVRIGPKNIIVSDKEVIKQMLVTDEMPKSENYDTLRVEDARVSLFVTRDVSFHKKRRRILTPAFSLKYLASLEPLMQSCLRDLTTKLDESIDNDKKIHGAIVNIYELIRNTAMDIIGETAFGESFSIVKNGNHPLPRLTFRELVRRVLCSTFPALKLFLKMDPFIDEFSIKMINKRKNSEIKKNDLLQIMLDSINDVKGGMEQIEICEQMLEFIFAGTDSGSYIITMTIIELLRHPESMEKLIKELDAALINNNGEFPLNDEIKHLPYLTAVINETLRLYPIMMDVGVSKQLTKDSIMCGYFIPKGTCVNLNIYAIHYSKEYWGENAEKWIPERWLDLDKLPKNAFFPFSAGSRNCIGINFAWLEIRIIIATLLQRYKLEDMSDQKLNFVQFITPSLKNQSEGKIDTPSLWEKVMSKLPTDKFLEEDIPIDSLTIKELNDWTKGIAQTCLRGNASLVYSVDELSPPESAKSLANPMRYKKKPSQISFQNMEEQPQFFTTADKQIEVEKILLILDNIYDSVDEVPYFRTEEDFSPNVPRYAPLQTILSSFAIRSVQTVDNYILHSVCSTTNTSFHRYADRSIFYNSLSSGLSSAVIIHVSRGLKTDVLIDIISTLAIQLHMVKSIASLAGLDTADDAVRTLIYLCIVSDGVKSSIAETAKELAMIIMRKMVVDQIPASALRSINKRVAMKLLSKEVGGKGLINFASLIPFVGELVTFISDSLTTYGIGQVSKYVFCPTDDTSETKHDDDSPSSPPPHPGRIEL
ncbi:17679_t:CDS:10 [Funneliformis caledonium]|uniref:17679_t:CDS:1 n=1 Tax=Funneliformis caledonium TaxID=1117310 RepID=A0A9N9F5T6_9GLOM|nr:17679_t:CDS:10 [Funneliformis caledonium]